MPELLAKVNHLLPEAARGQTQHPQVFPPAFAPAAGIGIAVLVVGGILIALQLRGGPNSNAGLPQAAGGKGFFTDDDGATFYVDDITNIPPYDHNGKKAYRYTVAGSVKSGMKITYMTTLIEGASEIAIVNTWTTTADYVNRREALELLATNVTGL